MCFKLSSKSSCCYLSILEIIAKSGIVGVHRQALYLSAFRQEFKERLKKSPVYLLEHVLGLVGPIKIVNGNIVIKEEPIGVKSHYFGEDLDSFTTYYLQE